MTNFNEKLGSKPILSIRDSSHDNTNTEKCILCGVDTKVPIDTPIGDRKEYIEGCGQLCKECYNSLEASDDIKEKFLI